MNGNEKAARIVERLREIEVLANPRPFYDQLQSWSSKDTWSEDTSAEISELLSMVDTLLKEIGNGS